MAYVSKHPRSVTLSLDVLQLSFRIAAHFVLSFHDVFFLASLFLIFLPNKSCP